MKFRPTHLNGAWLVEPEFHVDMRGSFARTFCVEEFSALGLEGAVTQCSLSFNSRRGTLRGIHFQLEPRAETKLVRVQKGAVWDVIVDLRSDSPTFLSWFGTELSADNAHALYIPKGFGHGFITLVDDAEVSYQMSACYAPELAAGVRWNDPAIGIAWPIEPKIISDRDRALPSLAEVMPKLSAHH